MCGCRMQTKDLQIDIQNATVGAIMATTAVLAILGGLRIRRSKRQKQFKKILSKPRSSEGAEMPERTDEDKLKRQYERHVARNR